MSDFDNVTTPAAGDTASTQVPASNGTPAVTAPATSVAAPQAPATGAAPEGYVPSYRIREAREAALRQSQNEWAQKEAVYNAKMEQLTKNLQALTGVQPQNADPVREVRDQFGRVYPNLAKMEDQYEKFEQLLNRFPDLEAQQEHYWTSHATQTMDRLHTLAQADLGGNLSEAGKRNLQANFVGYLQSNPEAAQRYSYDPSVVNEFWKEFTSNFIEPVKRSSAANTLARAPQNLPQDAPSGNAITGGPAKPKDLDDRVGKAWDAFNATKRK